MSATCLISRMPQTREPQVFGAFRQDHFDEMRTSFFFLSQRIIRIPSATSYSAILKFAVSAVRRGVMATCSDVISITVRHFSKESVSFLINTSACTIPANVSSVEHRLSLTSAELSFFILDSRLKNIFKFAALLYDACKKKSTYPCAVSAKTVMLNGCFTEPCTHHKANFENI